MEAELGLRLAQMLATMRDRGPDSAGFAVFGDEDAGVKLTLRGPAGTDFAALGQVLNVGLDVRDTHAVLHVPSDRRADILAELEARGPAISVVGEGRRMELYKEVGSPDEVPLVSAWRQCVAPTLSAALAWRPRAP